jgi:hypothetical protein
MRPTLVTNPADDDGFAALAARFIDAGVDGIDELERRLRSVYPKTAVHARLLSGEPRLIWYVYREGRWIDGRGPSRDDGGFDGRSAADE